MAGRYDLLIDQGSTFTRTFIYKDQNGDVIDITGRTPRMMIRDTHNAAGAPLFDSDLEAGSLTIPNGTDGKIELVMTDEITQALPAPVDAAYDIELDEAGAITRILEGAVITSPNVTRDDSP